MSNRSEYLPDENEVQSPPANGNGKPIVPPMMYEAIKIDQRITHGAFRLWHMLKDMCMINDNRFCWPGIRRLAALLHTDDRSITRWRKKLVACGYLEVEIISKANAPASRKLGGFLYRVGQVPSNTGQQTLDSFYRSLDTGRNNPDGKSWTRKTRQQRRDVDTVTQEHSSPLPPKGENSGRSATVGASRKDGREDKPRIERRTVMWRLGEIESEIKKIKQDEKSFKRRLSPSVEEALKYIESRLADAKDSAVIAALKDEAERRRVNPHSYVRGEMTDDAKARIAALREEQNQLKAALAKKLRDAL